MDRSHLLPVATPQHHTEFSHPSNAEDQVKLTTSNDVPISSRPGTGRVYSPVRPRVERTVTDEGTIPSNIVPSNIIPSFRRKPRKTLVLCFDGTGNEFHGDSSDSNILKIFRMLDRSGGSGFHYYQPGIGTYVTGSSLSSTGSLERLKNWYMKAKDSAVGTSFDQHVVGGYKFLMQYYSPGDNIYMFGFSRGSYTARFLSEMLDWVGLITHGNEEMIQFAWRTFSNWKAMNSSSQEAMKKQKKAYEFMVSFRETFSRPVRRIRYLGLFDTVNSVPRFENAMMSRVHMPYSAKSSAKVIRHAVSIDERRAKFRSDLVSPEGLHKKETDAAKAKHMHEKELRHERHMEWFHQPSRYKPTKQKPRTSKPQVLPKQYREGVLVAEKHHSHLGLPHFDIGSASASRYRTRSRSRSIAGTSADLPPMGPSRSPSPSLQSINPPSEDESSDGDESDQDIEELWFPGGHADIGGGWELQDDEVPLSHVPLVWIVREAKKTGLQFDEEKMFALGCLEDVKADAPIIELQDERITNGDNKDEGIINGQKAPDGRTFHERVADAVTKGKLHDCLEIGKGLPVGSVLSWRMMEWIPFRRMDLRDDGSWKPIRWPLPRGEVRDMPSEAKIHNSALKRMQADPNYRPGNLILGGGGRGVKRAPTSAGTGDWILVKGEGDAVGECWVRKPKPAKGKEGNGQKNGERNGEKNGSGK